LLDYAYLTYLATGKYVTVTWHVEWTNTAAAGERLIILTVSSQTFI